MTWEAIFDLPCGCKRHPANARVGSVLIQQWDDICETHRALKTDEPQPVKQMRESQMVAEELQELALERLKAKGKI
jgi:hypothetical protein